MRECYWNQEANRGKNKQRLKVCNNAWSAEWRNTDGIVALYFQACNLHSRVSLFMWHNTLDLLEEKIQGQFQIYLATHSEQN